MTLSESLAIILHASDRIRARLPSIESGDARALEVLAADLVDIQQHVARALWSSAMEYVRRGGR